MEDFIFLVYNHSSLGDTYVLLLANKTVKRVFEAAHVNTQYCFVNLVHINISIFSVVNPVI